MIDRRMQPPDSFCPGTAKARLTISSREGVIRPERPMMSALCSSAAANIFSQGHITPTSITCIDGKLFTSPSVLVHMSTVRLALAGSSFHYTLPVCI
jgi:hypothetical protein